MWLCEKISNFLQEKNKATNHKESAHPSSAILLCPANFISVGK